MRRSPRLPRVVCCLIEGATALWFFQALRGSCRNMAAGIDDGITTEVVFRWRSGGLAFGDALSDSGEDRAQYVAISASIV
jgi:hypothetical protein